MSRPTQDTTLPLKQGSFALSSEISSFTTLEKNKQHKIKTFIKKIKKTLHLHQLP